MKRLANRTVVAALAASLALTSAIALAEDDIGSFETVTSGTAISQDTWTPPTAEQLDQLLAPVAVFPDSLVAQVLAAASHPEQVSEAEEWRSRNPSLKDADLERALAQKDWDPGVKAVAGFPDVLRQMASNLPWTRALGEAYVNDPTDVLNAVQSLRNKAVASGKLKSNKYLTVRTTTRDEAPPPREDDAYDDDAPPVYDGPAIIDPPDDIVEIEPAEPDYVYVPYYDPWAFYGYAIAPWPGYAWAWPSPAYYGPAYGVFGFGAAISLDFGFGYAWGWHAWNTRWWGWHDRGWRGPCVVYNDRRYFDHSSHIVNHFAGRGGWDRGNFAGRAGAASPRDAFAGRVNAFRGPHTAPSQYARLSAPRFDASMARSGARDIGAANRNGFARPVNVSSRSALPSSRYAPRGDMQRAGDGFASMRGGAMPRSNAATAGSRVAPAYARSAPAYARGYANGGGASAQMRSYAPRSYSTSSAYAALVRMPRRARMKAVVSTPATRAAMGRRRAAWEAHRRSRAAPAADRSVRRHLRRAAVDRLTPRGRVAMAARTAAESLRYRARFGAAARKRATIRKRAARAARLHLRSPHVANRIAPQRHQRI
jgi:hypothetical protein